MHSLQLVHQYQPDFVGGTELYTAWLAQGLSQSGHDVSIFYRRSGEGDRLESRIDPSGERVWAATAGEVTPNRRFANTFRHGQLHAAFAQVVAETKPDLVHIQHLMGLPVSLLKVLQQGAIPYVVTLHDFWWVCANAQLFTNYDQTICQGPRACVNCARCALARANRSAWWPAIPGLAGLLAHRNRLLKAVLLNAQAIIAPSQFVADWYGDHGIPRKLIQVIPHGIPLPGKSIDSDKTEARPFRFGYIGGLSVQKGVHILLEAFTGMRTGLADETELWIAGDETADPAYVARLHQQASDQVRFLGRLSREQVWEMLGDIDVLVVPTLWYESFSLIVSEAFAMRVPVIASRLGPLTERIRDGVDGQLVPPGDLTAWGEVLENWTRNPTLVASAKAQIKPPLSLEAHVALIEQLYDTVLSLPNRS